MNLRRNEPAKTPEEIKNGLILCKRNHCSKTCPYHGMTGCYAATHKDALAYIARLEAELTATRSELEREGDLCSICKHNKQDREQCIGCLECTNEECACYKCLKAATEEGYEWDGGEA